MIKFTSRSQALTLIVLAAVSAGCANMSSGEKDTALRSGTGAAMGMAAGALIDNGGAGGLAAGAAIGALGGWLYDKHEKSEGN